MKTAMKRYYKILALVLFIIPAFSWNAAAQNVIENEEANLKEFDLESFKDAAVKIKDSSVMYIHMAGIKWGYSMSSVSFMNTKIHKGIKSSRNVGIYYTYLHSLLNSMPYFGIQTGLASTQVGYTHVTEIDEGNNIGEEQVYSALELPLVSLFRVDIERVRLMLGIGGYLSYIYGTELPGGIIPETTKKGNFGLLGQAGIALKLNPIEIFVEASYKYGLTPFLDHKTYSEEHWIYTNPTQLQFSAGLNFVLGRKYHRKK